MAQTKAELEQIARDAGEAGMLLGNPLLKGAFEAIEAQAVAHIKVLQFGPEESEIIRDKLMLTLQVVEGVRDQLREYVETGQISNKINTEEY